MARTSRSLGLVVFFGIATVLGGVACGSRTGASSGVGEAAAGEPLELERAALRLSLNEAEGSVELVVEVAAPVGLRRLTVLDPEGRVVIDETVGSGAPAGVDEVCLQAPEEGASFIEGPYRIEAVTVEGARIVAGIPLVFDLLPAPGIVSPPPALEEPIHPDEVVISWTPVPEAEAYIVEVEIGEEKVLVATLLPTTTSLAIPPGILHDEAECEVNIITVSPSGNRTEVDGSFVTGAR
jgi:hypothetical protein